ncbi:MAG: MATE family efflux transporter [Lachnospiraceae bacterium]|nr:MATE family efflux transporter [Lachnospiraceae bacterium]
MAEQATVRTEKNSKKYEIDMCSGPFLGKILMFYIPLMLSGVLQLLFNAADIVVVGRFAGHDALAAVGSTSSLINLLVNFFMGLSIGANVLVARFYGAGQKKELSEMVHTAILTSVISGFILLILGVIISEPALRLMGTPDDVIGQSTLYMRIYFCGMPFFMAYNFGAAVLRAVGDTKRPLYYLLAAGVINVALNLVFVIAFSMGVAGVAIATAISQTVSAMLVIRCLIQSDADYKLEVSKLHIVKDKMLKMMQIGLPAGLQSSLFSISNVLIQSSVNSFGSIAMAGNTAASNIEGFVYTSMNAFSQTVVSFTGQNYGAQKYKNIAKVLLICQGMVAAVGLVLGNAAYLGGGLLLQLYSTDVEVIEFGLLRMSIICTTYCLCGMMDTMVGALRGLGCSIMPTIVSLTGACLFRVVWIYTVFAKHQTLSSLYISYPISWTLTMLAHIICFLFVYRKLTKKT